MRILQKAKTLFDRFKANSGADLQPEVDRLTQANRKKAKKIVALSDGLRELQLTVFADRGDCVTGTTDPLSKYYPIEFRAVEKPIGTLFVFSGLAQYMGIPSREFFKTLEQHNYNIVFFKDFDRCWYQKGVLGFSTSRHETALKIQERFGNSPRPWSMIGSSAGGYAALIFGKMLDAERVIAYSPQTVINSEIFTAFGGSSKGTYDFKDPLNDVAQFLNATKSSGVYDVHFGSKHGSDKNAAERLGDCANCNLIGHDTNSHNLPLYLKESGSLMDTILPSSAK